MLDLALRLMAYLAPVVVLVLSFPHLCTNHAQRVSFLVVLWDLQVPLTLWLSPAKHHRNLSLYP